MTGRESLEKVQNVEGYPLQGNHLHVSQQMGEVEGGEGVDQAGDERWNLGIGYWILDIGYWVLRTGYWVLGIEYIPCQEVGAVAADGEGEEHHGVVGWQQPPGQLHRHRQQAVEGIEGVEIQADAAGMVEQIGGEGQAVLLEQRHLHPPQVPVVLPAVEAIARDGRGEPLDQRVGQQEGQE